MVKDLQLDPILDVVKIALELDDLELQKEAVELLKIKLGKQLSDDEINTVVKQKDIVFDKARDERKGAHKYTDLSEQDLVNALILYNNMVKYYFHMKDAGTIEKEYLQFYNDIRSLQTILDEFATALVKDGKIKEGNKLELASNHIYSNHVWKKFFDKNKDSELKTVAVSGSFKVT